jgi:hypothetical protein
MAMSQNDDLVVFPSTSGVVYALYVSCLLSLARCDAEMSSVVLPVCRSSYACIHTVPTCILWQRTLPNAVRASPRFVPLGLNDSGCPPRCRRASVLHRR